MFNFKIPKSKKKGKRKKGPISKESKNKYGELNQVFAQMMDLGFMGGYDDDEWERHINKNKGGEEDWEDIEESEEDKSQVKHEEASEDEWEDI